MIAVILPKNKNDYLANTIIDGLISLGLDFKITKNYPYHEDLSEYELSEIDFIKYAENAKHIFFLWGKGNTNYELAEKINLWNKTIFIDGSEPGKNRRYTYTEEQKLAGIDHNMLTKCKLYFRREKPYIKGIIPLPFGIDTRIIKPQVKKDLDFFCSFGQDEYPLMRRYATEYIRSWAKKNNFLISTDKMPRDAFYETLARSKVGVSIGGGGFDTARFWETLGNNCILLTETIDIDRTDLNYSRIHEFKDMEEFKILLEKIGNYIRTEYNQDNMKSEYMDILAKHSSAARVKKILYYASK